MEVTGIQREHLSQAKAILASAGLVPESTGPAVRSVVACKGTVCRHGRCDTFGPAQRLEEEYGGRPLPHKFKIAVAGCPNNCAWVQLNDLGFLAHCYPLLDPGECTNCGACAEVCREGAIEMRDEVLHFVADRCIGCGDCIAACPQDAVGIAGEGLSLFLGGRAGRAIRIGTPVPGLVAEAEVPEITDFIITFFTDNTCKGERFGEMMDRIGVETVLHGIGLDR